MRGEISGATSPRTNAKGGNAPLSARALAAQNRGVWAVIVDRCADPRNRVLIRQTGVPWWNRGRSERSRVCGLAYGLPVFQNCILVSQICRLSYRVILALPLPVSIEGCRVR